MKNISFEMRYVVCEVVACDAFQCARNLHAATLKTKHTTFKFNIKKTIITLLALAGVAAADQTPITLWETGSNVNTDGKWALSNEDTETLTSSNWSLTKADGSALSSTTANATELRPNTNVGNEQGWSLDFTLTNSTAETVTLNTLTFDTLIFAGTGSYQGENTNRDFVFTLTYGETALTTDNWTIAGNTTSKPGNGVVTFDFGEGIELAAGQSVALGFDVAKGTNNAGCYLGLHSISAATTAAAIPEPTTVTLSLLALAGLAARRRRR